MTTFHRTLQRPVNYWKRSFKRLWKHPWLEIQATEEPPEATGSPDLHLTSNSWVQPSRINTSSASSTSTMVESCWIRINVIRRPMVRRFFWRKKSSSKEQNSKRRLSKRKPISLVSWQSLLTNSPKVSSWKWLSQASRFLLPTCCQTKASHPSSQAH